LLAVVLLLSMVCKACLAKLSTDVQMHGLL
jgi:hypothetical protein